MKHYSELKMLALNCDEPKIKIRKKLMFFLRLKRELPLDLRLKSQLNLKRSPHTANYLAKCFQNFLNFVTQLICIPLNWFLITVVTG